MNATLESEIAARSRLCDDIPEKVPTALARELVNHYPADVKRAPDRLATLAATLLGRERADAAEERMSRWREADAFRARIAGLEAELKNARALEQRRLAQLDELVAVVERISLAPRRRRRRLLHAVRAVALRARASALATESAIVLEARTLAWARTQCEPFTILDAYGAMGVSTDGSTESAEHERRCVVSRALHAKTGFAVRSPVIGGVCTPTFYPRESK